MDIPIATALATTTVLVSIGASWGMVKTVVSKNSKEIERLRQEFLTTKEYKTFRDGCQALLLTKIEEVKNDQKDFKNEIQSTLTAYDIKREKARSESQQTLEKIHKFMGRVDEYIRIKNGN